MRNKDVLSRTQLSPLGEQPHMYVLLDTWSKVRSMQYVHTPRIEESSGDLHI